MPLQAQQHYADHGEGYPRDSLFRHLFLEHHGAQEDGEHKDAAVIDSVQYVARYVLQQRHQQIYRERGAARAQKGEKPRAAVHFEGLGDELSFRREQVRERYRRGGQKGRDNHLVSLAGHGALLRVKQDAEDSVGEKQQRHPKKITLFDAGKA